MNTYTDSMKNLLNIILFCTSFLMISMPAIKNPLRIGDQMPLPNHRVTDVSGRSLTLAEVSGRNGVLVIFSANTCPWVSRWEQRYNAIATLAQLNGIGMIALNPNEEIRDKGESIADMKKRAQKQGYSFPYALDKNHTLADAFGATRTPEVFLFDSNMKLVYHGAIDDNAMDASSAENTYLTNAIQAMADKKEINPQVTPLAGCTIKRLK